MVIIICEKHPLDRARCTQLPIITTIPSIQEAIHDLFLLPSFLVENRRLEFCK